MLDKMVNFSRCYAKVWQMEFPLLHKGGLFDLSSGMLNRTSYQICDRWYLSMLSLRDGPLTFMYIDTAIVPAMVVDGSRLCHKDK